MVLSTSLFICSSGERSSMPLGWSSTSVSPPPSCRVSSSASVASSSSCRQLCIESTTESASVSSSSERNPPPSARRCWRCCARCCSLPTRVRLLRVDCTEWNCSEAEATEGGRGEREDGGTWRPPAASPLLPPAAVRKEVEPPEELETTAVGDGGCCCCCCCCCGPGSGVAAACGWLGDAEGLFPLDDLLGAGGAGSGRDWMRSSSLAWRDGSRGTLWLLLVALSYGRRSTGNCG